VNFSLEHRAAMQKINAVIASLGRKLNGWN
jgi:hypothetical protein